MIRNVLAALLLLAAVLLCWLVACQDRPRESYEYSEHVRECPPCQASLLDGRGPSTRYHTPDGGIGGSIE